MKNFLKQLAPVFISIFLVPFAPSETEGSHVPFVAVDAERGTFHKSIESALVRSRIGHKLLSSPITSEQLKGAGILLISGPFRTELSKPKEDEITEKLYSNAEIYTIKKFVEDGGILIGAGISWTWVYPAYGNKSLESFPLNQIGEALNFSVLGCCKFEKYDRNFFGLVKEPEDPAGNFSNVEFKGSSQKLIYSNRGVCGRGAKRGKGYIYIFGHKNILEAHPELVPTVFLGLSPQKQIIDGLVDNTAKKSEGEKKQEPAPARKPIPEAAVSNINPLDLLAQEGPNLIAWVTSPLEVDIPVDLRARISLLREDMLDGQSESETTSKMYAAGAELCASLISVIDKRELKQVESKLKVAQAKERSPLSNQSLEARRNYLMSWPQYEREVIQREVLSEKKVDKVEVKSREVEAAWIVTAGEFRKALDDRYSEFRATIRRK